ncbi:methylated-DNA--protein-cysteine methyltransferase-like [Penaeus monodon]|uniref:methylated-DNA--protein-cysteine methyltransferase-like n=1 Tax=Penaeus monodon TaxID=6687 RepID=UPI0018A7CC19|nr:methylated-DNA--protein-cysteine methyltransferase-like [Penaeus monodon]
MAPKRKKLKTACELPESEYRISSPLGFIIIRACNSGLHSTGLEGELSDENFTPNLRQGVKLLGSNKVPQVIKKCEIWFRTYFDDPKNMNMLERPDICVFKKSNLAFRELVWKTLADTVGPGEVITYGALADKLKNPGAVRAVGSAMRNNPNGIIVPCHRVVRTSGLGLYHGGTRQSVKVWLLNHEGITKYT